MDINYLAVAENYPDLHNCSVTVIGLGYVGLPLAVDFAKRKKCNVTGKFLKTSYWIWYQPRENWRAEKWIW